MNQTEDTMQEQTNNKNKFIRETAKLVNIDDIVNSNYIREEGWKPNYLDTRFGKVSRINIIGIIVSIEDNKIIIDDSTNKIEIRFFDNSDMLKSLKIGEYVNVIGRPREFNNEKYIIPEIVKKIEDKNFIEFRKLEILYNEIKKGIKKNNSKNKSHINQKNIIENNIENEKINKKNKEEKNKIETTEKIKEKSKEDIKKEEEIIINSSEEIINFIEKNDDGDGVYIDNIIESLKEIKDCENKIKKLLEMGDIFIIKPGKVKIL